MGRGFEILQEPYSLSIWKDKPNIPQRGRTHSSVHTCFVAFCTLSEISFDGARQANGTAYEKGPQWGVPDVETGSTVLLKGLKMPQESGDKTQ